MATELERYWLDRLPDEPRWVDFRGLLCEGRSEVLGDRDGCVILTPDYPGGSIIGRPKPDVLEQAKRWRSTHAGGPSEMLAQPEDAEILSPSFAGWRRGGAIIHRLEIERRRETRTVEHPVRLLTPSDRPKLADLPAEMKFAIENAFDRGLPVAAAFSDDSAQSRPVAFCNSALETESLWDVSVQTLPAFRRKGLAEACFLAVEDVERTSGRTAIWGAHDDNQASIALAKRLGFVPTAELIVYFEPEESSQ